MKKAVFFLWLCTLVTAPIFAQMSREDFDREIYGRVSDSISAVSWKIIYQKDTVNGRYPVHIDQLVGQVENLASWFEYHWFAPNFITYAGPLTPNDLPFDTHELIALCAPRPVFISCGAPEVEGYWMPVVCFWPECMPARCINS